MSNQALIAEIRAYLSNKEGHGTASDALEKLAALEESIQKLEQQGLV